MAEPTAFAATVDLSPIDFAALLGLPAEDAPYLATAPVRLPAAWVAAWHTKTGVRELTVADLCVVLSCTPRTIFRYMERTARPRFSYRLGVLPGSHRGRMVSPANLVLFLRERSRMAGAVPQIGETAGQASTRAAAAKLRVAQLCGD